MRSLFSICSVLVLTRFVSTIKFEITVELQDTYNQSDGFCNVNIFDLCHMNHTDIDYSACNATILYNSINNYIETFEKVIINPLAFNLLINYFIRITSNIISQYATLFGNSIFLLDLFSKFTIVVYKSIIWHEFSIKLSVMIFM